MISYQKDEIQACQEEMEPLLLKQFTENESDNPLELDPDYDTYDALEYLGVAHIWTARDNGKLVGYLTVMVNNHLHHRTTTVAMSDVLYLLPEYRGSKVAADLIRMAEEELKEMGVHSFLISMKIKQEFRRLLSALNYGPIEEMWEKIL